MRKSGAAAVALVLCLAVGGVPAMANGKAPPTQSATTGEDISVRSGRSFEKIRGSIPSDTYGGAYLDRKSGALRVMVTKTPQLSRVDLTTDAPVELVPVKYSLAYLERRKDEVFAARNQLNDAASRIVTVDANEVKNSLEVAIAGPITSALRDRIARIAPDTPLDLVPGPRPASTSGVSPDAAVSRVDDVPQWSSGTFIYTPAAGLTCTSGPGVKVGSTKFMVTAGHCAKATGQLVRQGHPSVAGTLQDVGTVANRSGYPNLDAMLVNANTAATLFRSWYNYVVVGSAPWESLTGQTVCTGGAYAGERCAISVGATNICDSRPEWNHCGMTKIYRTDGSIVAGKGDSGGPVYILAPGIRYSGIITATQELEDWFNCPNYPSGTRLCSSYMYMTRIQNILSYYGATLL